MSAKRILIIDDDEPLKLALGTVLMKQGHEVDTCKTGSAGLERMMEKLYNIALIDYYLPDMDSLKVTQKIREIDREVTIIFTIPYKATEIILKAVEGIGPL
jgi:DNA-binding response OmpR family regulator